jgi:hypothetical protein
MNDSESDSIFGDFQVLSLGLAVRTTKKEYISRTVVVKVILKYKDYAIKNKCVLERRLTRRILCL